MSGGIENLLLAQIKAFRSELKEMRLAMHEEFKELKQRLTQRELHAVGARRDSVGEQEAVYWQQVTIDRLNERLDRVERRLELIPWLKRIMVLLLRRSTALLHNQ